MQPLLQFSEIDKRRAAAGIRQDVLAARANMTKQAYTKLKKAGAKGPTEDTLQRLNRALGELSQVASHGG